MQKSILQMDKISTWQIHKNRRQSGWEEDGTYLNLQYKFMWKKNWWEIGLIWGELKHTGFYRKKKRKKGVTDSYFRMEVYCSVRKAPVALHLVSSLIDSHFRMEVYCNIGKAPVAPHLVRFFNRFSLQGISLLQYRKSNCHPASGEVFK